jgi:hypothetical protein
MVSHQAQLNFLKDLVLQSNPEESRRLLRRLHQAERQELLSRRWTILIALGIASWWIAVLLVTPGGAGVWRPSDHPVAVLLSWMGGMALFGLLLVGSCWLWHRASLRRIIQETHRYLAGWLVCRAQPIPSTELMRANRHLRIRVPACLVDRQLHRFSCRARRPSPWRRRRS